MDNEKFTDIVEIESEFMGAVWEALKSDTNDLRKQQRILKAFRVALELTSDSPVKTSDTPKKIWATMMDPYCARSGTFVDCEEYPNKPNSDAEEYIHFELYDAVCAERDALLDEASAAKRMYLRACDEANKQKARAEKAENTDMRKVLEEIVKPQYGLQGIIEDGDCLEERAEYFARLCYKYQNLARAALKENVND